ncbi:LYR motif-containing protein 4-like [Babylonia areolata]|uniref:LYR motif-containing protein 4-like n=1 Tax=Babylonia areolata TaxID=304850 RepID=UPI003FD59151
MSATRARVLSLYKKMLREGQKFTDYNFRKYAVRRTQDGFHHNMNVSDAARVQELIQEAEENLKIMQRQVLVGQLYGEGKLVIESMNEQDKSSR